MLTPYDRTVRAGRPPVVLDGVGADEGLALLAEQVDRVAWLGRSASLPASFGHPAPWLRHVPVSPLLRTGSALHTVDARNADVVEPPRSDEGFRVWTAERPPDPAAYRLVIEIRFEHAFVGAVSVGGTDARAGRFRTGIEVAREHRRRGYAAEATELVLTYMFAEQRSHKCEVEAYAFNDASLALYRKLGFVEEGRLRQHEFFAGAYQDVVLLGITADEYRAKRPRPSLR